jgi:hypothetical protein
MSKTIDEQWRDAFVKIARTEKGKHDVGEIADSMQRMSALMIENVRGPRLTAASLTAAAAFFLQRAMVHRQQFRCCGHVYERTASSGAKRSQSLVGLRFPLAGLNDDAIRK